MSLWLPLPAALNVIVRLGIQTVTFGRAEQCDGRPLII